jgi:hypothetical protein
MKKPAKSIEIPAPRAVMHSCGEPAVEKSYFSPRAAAVVSVIICSACDPTFYPKASRELRAARAA